MNAMPPMVRHQGTAAPAFAGRGQGRAEQGTDSFDLVLSETGRGDRSVDAKADRVAGADEELLDVTAVDRDETADETAAETGILPLLRIALPHEKDGAGPAAEDPLADAAGTSEAELKPDTEADPRAAVPTGPAEDARPRGVALTASAKTGQAAESRPSTARPSADGLHAPSTTGTQSEVSTEVPAQVAVDEDNRLRIEAAVAAATAPQAVAAAAPGASASLSLLARLNQMNAPTARTGSAQPAVNADRSGGEDAQPAGEAAPDDNAGIETARAFRPAEDSSNDRPADARNPADGAGRAADRSSSVAAVAPSAGQPPSASTQVVQALASNTNGLAHARAVEAAAHRNASAGETVQSLQIQLKPHDLGEVTARLTMDGDQLSIEIEVDTIEAHRRLSNESDAIAKALRAHGIAVDQVTVQQPSHSSGPASDGSTSNSSAFAGRDARDSGSSGNRAGRNQAHPSSDADHGQETRSTAESHAPGARGGSGVYI